MQCEEKKNVADESFSSAELLEKAMERERER